MAKVIDRHQADRAGTGMRWCVRYEDEQKRSRRKSFKKKSEADRFASEIEIQLATGTYNDPKSGKITVGEYASKWIAGRLDLAPSTLALYEGWLRLYILPHFGRIPLNLLKAEHAHKYLIDEQITIYNRKRTMMLLRQIINSAVAENLIPANLLAHVKLPKTQSKPTRFLTHLELKRLSNAVDPFYRPLFLTAGYAGLRQGELFGLHPRNVDLDSGFIRVVEQLCPTTLERRPPKSNSFRTVAIPPSLIEILAEQLEERSTEDLVFPNKNTYNRPEDGFIRKSNFIRRTFQPACEVAGLKGLTFHGLRHTAGSIWLDAGMNIKVIQERLGHKDIQTTLNIYAHLMPNADAEAVKLLEGLISEDTRPQLVALDSA